VIFWIVPFLLFLLLPFAAVAGCSKPHPCLTIVVNPPTPSITSGTPPGTVVATLTVDVIPKGSFTGTLTFGSPYGNDVGLFALSGSDLVLVKRVPTGDSVENVTVVATQ
jgi:hypothetical protein